MIGKNDVEHKAKRYVYVIIAAVIGLLVFIAKDTGPSIRIIQNPIPHMTNIFNITSIVQNMVSQPKAKKPSQYFICPVFVGRGGNQLFIFASSFGVAMSKGMKVLINSQSELLRVFDLKVEVRKDTSICNSRTVKVLREAHSATYDKRLTEFNGTSNVRLTVYLQSYLYFDKYSQELRKQFTFKDTFRKKAISLLDKYLEQFNVHRPNQIYHKYSKPKYTLRNNSTKVTLIGVHIRRGDYVRYPEVGYRPASKEYLQRAVEWYKNRYQNLIFIVISNGMDWAKNNMPKNIKVTYLEGKSSWDDMATVTLCDHFIATVGSFSWWAAWLTGGHVTYFKWPAREGTRFRKGFSKDFKDHYPPKWIGL